MIARENLNNQGHETFLPIVSINNKEVAIFPGYIFVKPRLEASYISIKSTKYVKNFIKFGDEFPKISESLIEIIKSRIVEFETSARYQNQYQKGTEDFY